MAVDPARMLANLELTRGLLFADAAAALLAPSLGHAAAHAAVERAAEVVRREGSSLRQALGHDTLVAAAFDLEPSVAAAAGWVDRVLGAAEARK